MADTIEIKNEVLKHKEAVTIVPFCILHYINPYDNTYRGVITNPQLTRDGNGKTTYQCSKTFPLWKHAGIFYAVVPMFSPVPVGMKLYCAEFSDSAPIRTTDVKISYDLFNFKDNCTYFTTYNRPVPNTVALYLHKLGNNVFPSFDNAPPTNGNWTQCDISPIFVIVNSTGKDFDPNQMKFHCVNGACIPWVDKPLVSYTESTSKPLSLTDCVITCNELQITNDIPNTITGIVKNMSSKNPPIEKNDNIGMIITIITILLVVGLVVFLYVSHRKTHQAIYAY